jgi:DNA-binding CsgD family transcriptional regulator
MESLTPREVEVLRLLSQGQTNPQIAQNLLVSRGTVKIHVQHIISKLGVSDRTQAAVRLNALKHGLLSQEILLPGEDEEGLRGNWVRTCGPNCSPSENMHM